MNSIDISQLASKLRQDVKNAIEYEVFKVCEKALRDSIMETVYSGKSISYTRTGEFLNAVKVKNVSVGHSQAEFEITIDATMMGMSPPSAGKFGSHMSFKGDDVRDSLAGWLNDGTNGTYYSHPAHGFFEKAESGLESKIVKAMASALKGNGWDVTYM